MDSFLAFVALVVGFSLGKRLGYQAGVWDAVLEFTEENHPGAKKAKAIMDSCWHWQEYTRRKECR